MKRWLIITLILGISGGLSAQTKTAAPNAQVVHQDAMPAASLKFKETEFDFGKIPQGKPVTHTFEFVNTGKTALSLENVQASCGCTTPEWNKNVIQPGGVSKIVVGYNAAAEGEFAKPVTVTYGEGQFLQLIIKGDVWTTPASSAPENNALNQFKKNQ